MIWRMENPVTLEVLGADIEAPGAYLRIGRRGRALGQALHLVVALFVVAAANTLLYPFWMLSQIAFRPLTDREFDILCGLEPQPSSGERVGAERSEPPTSLTADELVAQSTKG